MALAGQEWTTGTTVSAVGHTALVVWLLTGWGLTHEPLPFQVTTVSVVSGAEYAELVAATTPQPQTELGLSPEAPGTDAPPPAPEPLPEDSPPPTPEPPPVAPAEETPPPAAPEPIPAPAEVTDAVPDITPPAPDAPPPAPDLETALIPVPRPADRVAPDPVAPPPPDAETAPDVQTDSAPADDPAEVVEEDTDATAPEEAAPEIVTEAEEPSGAVETTLRPPARPTRLASAVEEPEPEPEPEPAREPETAPADDVADALAAALAADSGAGAGEPSAPATQGPPMTGAERDAFKLAVEDCWIVDAGSESARVTVTVEFDLDRDGRVIGEQVSLVSASGGGQAAMDVAYRNARIAVLRCQTQSGYQLPDDKYDQWRQVQMTFDPSGMRLN